MRPGPSIPQYVIPQELQRFQHPAISRRHSDAVASQLLEDISLYDNGGVYRRLESAVAQRFGCKFVLSVNSGTSAILSMYHSLGLEPGAEVIVPAYNFFAAAAPMLRLGLVPVLADCSENGNLSPASVVACIGPRTAAISVTHIWGVPAEMGEIGRLADQHGLAVVEDASHAHGASFDGRVVGTLGSAGAWSLQGKKILTAGEGGLFATNDELAFQRAVLLGHFNRRALLEVTNPSLRRFAVTGTGLNLRMHPLGAALVLSQLESFDQQIADRREVAAYLTKAIEKIPGLQPVAIPLQADPAWYAFPILFDEASFDGLSKRAFVDALHAAGAVEADIPESTRPLSDFPLFQTPEEAVPGYRVLPRRVPADLPGAYRYYRRVFKLPVWYGPRRMEFAYAYVEAIRTVADRMRNRGKSGV